MCQRLWCVLEVINAILLLSVQRPKSRESLKTKTVFCVASSSKWVCSKSLWVPACFTVFRDAGKGFTEKSILDIWLGWRMEVCEDKGGPICQRAQHSLSLTVAEGCRSTSYLWGKNVGCVKWTDGSGTGGQASFGFVACLCFYFFRC